MNKEFFLMLFIPVVVFLGMLYKPLVTMGFGETIQLKTQPFDPRDLFYGDYVIFDFEISEVPMEFVDDSIIEALNSDWYFKELPVYVSLENKGNGYEAVRVSEEKPSSSIYVKGKVYPYQYDENLLEIEYDFEQYFVEENTGHALEEMSREGKLLVHVKVNNGYAVITDVEEE